MKIGVALPTVGLDHGAELLLPVAEAAERLGFDSVWAADHALMSHERESEYPYRRSGTEIAMTPGMQWLEPLTTLAFVASRCERVRLGTSVLVLPYRNPVIARRRGRAALHLLSGDRLILAVGAGWMREEFAALGHRRLESAGLGSDEYIDVLLDAVARRPCDRFTAASCDFDDIVLAMTPARRRAADLVRRQL